jgi:hypothetical protein
MAVFLSRRTPAMCALARYAFKAADGGLAGQSESLVGEFARRGQSGALMGEGEGCTSTP